MRGRCLGRYSQAHLDLTFTFLSRGRRSKENPGQVVVVAVAQVFNPRTQEAQAGRFLSMRIVWSTE